jgi:hypothetical protein
VQKKYTILFLLCSCVCSTNAQDFDIPFPKKPDDFTQNLLTVLNDAPLKFAHVKGKPINKKDSIHKGSKIFDCKVKLPHQTAARFVQDSTTYIEYFFNDYNTLEDAEQAEVQLHAKLQKALYKRVMYSTQVFDSTNLLLKQTKIAYTLNRGFFHYNMATQIIRLENANKFKLLFQVYSGKPLYYYKILKNEPIGSFVWIHQLKKNLAALQYNSGNDCPTTIETFNCGGRIFNNDTTNITYYKRGYDDYADARMEFDIYTTHIRVSLGADYLFYFIPNKNSLYKQIAFIPINEIDNTKRNTIVLQITDTQQATNNGFLKHIDFKKNIPTTVSSIKKEFIIALSFIN